MPSRKPMKPDWLKAKCTTQSLRMEIDGPLDSALPDLFYMIGNAARRQAIIDEILRRHETLKAKEGS